MEDQQKFGEKELAVQRASYIKKLKITVKASKKTQDLDQLITIQTYNTQTKQSVELIMRKFSELDYFVEYLNERYGGHIIPFIKSDFFFQNNVNIQEIIPKIQQYLADLQHNRYCRQEKMFYCFILQQNMSFPKAIAYNKVLNHATDFSRKYLSSLFARKTVPHLENTQQYIEAHNTFQNQLTIYQSVKQVVLLKIKEILQLEEILALFADLNSKSQIAVQPFQIEIEKVWSMIKTSDKLIKQAQQAHDRWEILIEHTRELQNNVCKGLHEDNAMYQNKQKQVQQWNKSLSNQFLQLCEYLQNKLSKISNITKIIYGSMIQQSLPKKPNHLIPVVEENNDFEIDENHRTIRKNIEKQIIQYQRIETQEKLRKSSTNSNGI